MEYTDKDFVEYIIKNIVNHPDDVKISRKTDEMGVLLEVQVHPEDMGLLIGRSGATAKAIRILARIIGMRNDARVNLRILEPEGGRLVKEEAALPVSTLPDAPKEPSMRALESDSDIDAMMKDLQS